jgi:dinuclear metal center YbgI/SA1388 family protein
LPDALGALAQFPVSLLQVRGIFMSSAQEVIECLSQFAPPTLAADWDNVGWLVGDQSRDILRIMTCLTITPDVIDEAEAGRADLIVTHHPLPFRAVKSVSSATTVGRLLLRLISAKIAVYSPHTAFDSARAGINQHLAIGLGLEEIVPLIPAEEGDPEIGQGRCGIVPGEISLMEMAERLKRFLVIEKLQVVGKNDQRISRAAIACGSGGSFLEVAADLGCDCFITGEASYHTCLEAEARGVALLLPGHFASERFALDTLADYLRDLLTGVEVWACRCERDPLRSL